MPGIKSAGQLLRLLLFYGNIVVNFVVCGGGTMPTLSDSNSDDGQHDINKNYNRLVSKYFGENETYNHDKRLIIEDFYRQSALAAKAVREMNFHINHSHTVAKPNYATTTATTDGSHDETSLAINEANKNISTTVHYSQDLLNKLDSISSRGNLSTKMPAEFNSSSNKNDKWNGENPFKWKFSTTMHPINNSNKYSTNSTVKMRPSFIHQGSGMPKKIDAPMLNLVYDSHFKHRHADFRLGTHFDEVAVGSLINVTIQDGKTAFLNCKINLLQDKTVSWVRRMYLTNPDDETDIHQELQLLTVSTNTFVADMRYSVDFQYPNNFRLQIQNVTKRDEGIYECQISTHPPKVIQFYLHVNAPEVYIADENQNPLYERHYEVNSTLELYCYVHNIEMTSSVVLWIHNDHVLNYDAIRGGISVRTDLSEEGANSTLSVAKINKSDSGNYTCSVGPTNSFTTTVHVLNESFAELFYHGCSMSLIKYQVYSTQTLVILMAFLLLSLSNLLNSLSSNECLSIR